MRALWVPARGRKPVHGVLSTEYGKGRSTDEGRALLLYAEEADILKSEFVEGWGITDGLGRVERLGEREEP